MAVGFCKNCQQPIDPFHTLCDACRKGFRSVAHTMERCACGATLAPYLKTCYMCHNRAVLKGLAHR